MISMKYILTACIFHTLVLLSVSSAQLQNTGWKSPTAIHFPNDWSTPENAYVSDDFYAEVLHQSGCRCPFIDMSWDNGTSYSGNNIFGPYGTTDSFRTQGDSTDNWGHVWTDSELSDSNFVLRIWNSSTIFKQGYANFGFGIPAGSSIGGIEIRLEARGDSSYNKDLVDVIEVKVYYSLPTATDEVLAAGSQVTVFPIPARDMIRIRFDHSAEMQKVQVTNVSGEIIIENTISDIRPGFEYAMDISTLAAGIYFLNFSGKNSASHARFVIGE